MQTTSWRWVVPVASFVCVLIALSSPPAAAHGSGHDVAAAPPAAATPGSVSEYLPADRDLLVKVRLAGLWEMPAGQMAARKGVNPRVREIGTMISQQHGELDRLVVSAAEQVGVSLPDEPNADQRGWLAEMDQASGTDFDHVFVDRLRAAHGKVFPVIAAVRTGTRNPVVRQLAQRANDFVLTHLTLLESTGLVDFSALPPPPEPSPAPSAPASGGTGTSSGTSSGTGAGTGTAELSVAATGSPLRSVLWYVSAGGLMFLVAVALNHRRATRRSRAAWDGPQHRVQSSHRLTTPPAPRPSVPAADPPIRRSAHHFRH